MKCKWEGEHKGHNTVDLSEFREALKASLEDSVAKFESYRSALREVPETVTEWLTEDDGGLREVAELVWRNFSALREALDRKEEELLRGLEKKESEYDATKQLICDAQELAFEIPEISKGAEALLSGWESRKVTAKVAGEVLAVRKRMGGGKKIVEGLEKVEASEMSVNPERFLKGMKRKLEEIRAMEKIPVKRVLRDAPTGLSAVKVSSVFVSLRWDRSEQYDEFVIFKREEGREWSGEDESGNGDRGKYGCIRVDKRNGRCFVYR